MLVSLRRSHSLGVSRTKTDRSIRSLFLNKKHSDLKQKDSGALVPRFLLILTLNSSKYLE